MTRGACFIAYGDNARRVVQYAVQSLQHSNLGLPHYIQSRRVQTFGLTTDKQQSRYAKVTLPQWSPFDYTAYIDADTVILDSLAAGFKALERGYDLVISHSANQGAAALWHIDTEERAHTYQAVGFTPLQLQAGAFFYRRSEAMRQFFDAWRSEWLRFKDEDQAALLRALYQCPIKIWLLGIDWHDGGVIKHSWGTLR